MTALDGGLLARALVRPSQSQAAALRSEAAQTLALALLAKVAMARPTGLGPSGTHLGMGLVPIEGAAEWEAGCQRSA
ncbi:MAG: hypothetical protein U0838_02835 [Chloroflexota bacterium]